MAENDTRVESLEDEVKVLKGEVRRTLVDLRALLMREDSPLNEGSLGRRSTPVERDPNEGSPQTPVGVPETLRQVPSQSAGTGAPNHPVQDPPAALPNPPQPANPDQGLGNAASPFGGVGPGGLVPPQLGPQLGAGWPRAQQEQTPPPPRQGSTGLDSVMAERERRMAEQEQRMAEQERRIAGQELALANSERGRSGQERDLPDEGKKQDMPPQPSQPASNGPSKERPSAEVDVEVGGMKQQEHSGRPSARTQPREPDDGQAEEPSRPGQREELPKYSDEADGPENPPPRRQRQVQDSDDTSEDHERPLRRPVKSAARRRETGFENGHHAHGDDDDGNRPLNRNGSVSRVYDEYFRLLSETEDSYSAGDEASPSTPMDINLVASLVRWASIAKQRMGEDRLRDILELYLQSGHATPGLREVLTHISGMADAMPPKTNQTAQECVDLISHLHGILTGALAIAKAPQVKIPV